jgi:hypothetical protein
MIPYNKTTAKPIKMLPDTLFMMDRFLIVSFFRILPASITFNTSAIIFTSKQEEKIISLSRKVFVVANAVAFTSQNNRTLGLSELIRKPDMNIFKKSLFRNRTRLPAASFPKLTFLKKTKNTPSAIRNMLPTYPIIFLYSSAVATHSEKALLPVTNNISLTQTPITKLKPPSRPLFKLCFMIVKMTGPTDKARKNPSNNPFTSASSITIFPVSRLQRQQAV